MYIVKDKGGKPDRKTHPLPYCLRNPNSNLKSGNSQDNAQKPQKNYTIMKSASGKKREQGWFVIRTKDREQSSRGLSGRVDNDGVYFRLTRWCRTAGTRPGRSPVTGSPS